MSGRRLIVVSEREHAYLDVDTLEQVRVGRAPDNDVVLKDDMVSRRHCVIERGAEGGDAWRVRDLKSFNGTYLNERRVREEPVALWDAVRVGRTKMFLVDRLGEPSATERASMVETEPLEDAAPAPPPSAEVPSAEVPAAEGAEGEGEEVGGATRTMTVDGASVASVLQNKEIRGVIDDLLRREREKSEREVSRRVRDESAPAVLPPVETLAIRARRFGPLDGGGDFYDVFPGGPEESCLAVGSVSGVGVAACVAASAARHALRGLVAGRSHESSPLDLVRELRELLGETLHPGSAVSLLLARVAPGGRARVGTIGGTGVLLYDAARDAVQVLRAPGRRDEEAARPQLVEHVLRDGDRLLLLSDGAGSLRRQGGTETHGVERLEQALLAHKQLSVKELAQQLTDGFEDFCGGNPDRDATVMVVATR